MTRVALQNVTKIFPNGTVAVDDVSLDVGESELLVLLGPSGCGKSALLRVVAGLEDPTAGSVLLNGEPADHLQPWERGVAMVFQSYALYPHMSVGENIDFPLKLSGLEPAEREERTRGAASVLGITHLLGRRPANLSGGQRQRVAMGRAVVREPGLLLLDEPLSNIDAGLRAQLRGEIAGLARQIGASMIYVTHDQTEALSMADRLAIMRNGVLQGTGTPVDVYNRPATTYVASARTHRVAIPRRADRHPVTAGTTVRSGGRGRAALLRPARQPDRRRPALDLDGRGLLAAGDPVCMG